MIPVEEARRRVLAAFGPLPAETVGLAQGLGRVLAAPVAARLTQPFAALSAMDGYAVRAADLAEVPATLRRIGESAAGAAFAGRIGAGECARIFTGAPVPDGADAVVAQEDTAAEGESVTFRLATHPGRHIRPAGQDFRSGDALLMAGRRLAPRDLAVAAAMNVPWLVVRRRPRVAILAVGDELVLPGEPIGPSQIVAATGFGLAGMIEATGGTVVDLGVACDDMTALGERALAARGTDLLVTLGGASVGDRDLVRAALGAQGLELDFWQIAMRPGKPLMFGRMGTLPVLGLPGNPVSALICALLFVRPAVRALLGLPPEAGPAATARLGCDLPAGDRRQDYLRARLERDADGRAVATPFAAQDSAMLSVLAAADCLVIRPPHAPAARAGDPVEIIPLDAASGL